MAVVFMACGVAQRIGDARNLPGDGMRVAPYAAFRVRGRFAIAVAVIGIGGDAGLGACAQGLPDDLPQLVVLPCRDALQRRSEERRVGKECRSRWSPYH